MLSGLFSLLGIRRQHPSALSRAESELLGTLHRHPCVPLTGKEMLVARRLQGRGFVHVKGRTEAIITEKGVLALKDRA